MSNTGSKFFKCQVYNYLDGLALYHFFHASLSLLSHKCSGSQQEVNHSGMSWITTGSQPRAGRIVTLGLNNKSSNKGQEGEVPIMTTPLTSLLWFSKLVII